MAIARVHAEEGFHLSDQALQYATFQLNLGPTFEELRRGMLQKWRNCLNAAERSGVEVRQAAHNDDWEEFQELFEEFRKRKGFEVDLDIRFFREVQMSLPPSQRLTLLLASKDSHLVAGFLGSLLGYVAVYLLGATSEQALRTKSAYLLQWRAIELAKERGCRFYDLGGVDPDRNPGVYHFKKGIGGEELIAAGPYEASVPGLRSSVFRCVDSAYRMLHSAEFRKIHFGLSRRQQPAGVAR